MLHITVERKYPKDAYTIGNLYVENTLFCNTLEDTDRGLTSDMPLMDIKKKKIYGETAIPKGSYMIDMHTISPRYSNSERVGFTNGYMPRLVNVPGWEGVLIHHGNKAGDTLGCILVGKNTVKGMVTDSVNTFRRLYSVLKDASDGGEEIMLTIR